MRNIFITETGIDFETLKPTFSVECGCKTFSFRSKEFLLERLRQYIDDPEKFEEMLNLRMGCPSAVPREQINRPPDYAPPVEGVDYKRVR